MPILVSDLQLSAIISASLALCPSDRDAFIAAVARELAGQPVVGDGSVGRAIRTVQAAFPHPEVEPVPTRWQRRAPRFEKSSRRAW